MVRKIKVKKLRIKIPHKNREQRKERAAIALVAAFLLFSLDSLLYGVYEIEAFQQAPTMQAVKYAFAAVMVMFGTVLVIKKRVMIKADAWTLFGTALLVLWMLSAMAVNRDRGGIYIVFAILCGLLFVIHFPMELFFGAYRKILTVVSIASVTISALYGIFRIQMDALAASPGTGGFIRELARKIIVKCSPVIGYNSAIFRERGVFAIYLGVALIALFHYSREITKKELFEIAVYAVALLTTRGSSAFLIIVMLAAGLLAGPIARGKLPRAAVAVLIVACAFAAVYVPSEWHTLKMKLDFSSQTSDSGIARVASVVTPFWVILDHPAFGIGANTFIAQFQPLSDRYLGYSSTSFTNTWLGLGAYYGIFAGLFPCAGLACASWKLRSRYLGPVTIFAVLFLQYCLQPEYCIGIFWILILYGFAAVEKFGC